MHVLSAALAFAIIMLVLSMVVSVLVETIHRLFGMRERGLYYLLGQFYDQVLKPYANTAASSQPTPSVQTDLTVNQQARRLVGMPETPTVRNEEGKAEKDKRQREQAARTAFQDFMSENRTPVALTASAGPARISYPALNWSPHWPTRWSGVPPRQALFPVFRT